MRQCRGRSLTGGRSQHRSGVASLRELLPASRSSPRLERRPARRRPLARLRAGSVGAVRRTHASSPERRLHPDPRRRVALGCNRSAGRVNRLALSAMARARRRRGRPCLHSGQCRDDRSFLKAQQPYMAPSGQSAGPRVARPLRPRSAAPRRAVRVPPRPERGLKAERPVDRGGCSLLLATVGRRVQPIADGSVRSPVPFAMEANA